MHHGASQQELVRKLQQTVRQVCCCNLQSPSPTSASVVSPNRDGVSELEEAFVRMVSALLSNTVFLPLRSCRN